MLKQQTASDNNNNKWEQTYVLCMWFKNKRQKEKYQIHRVTKEFLNSKKLKIALGENGVEERHQRTHTRTSNVCT